MSKRKKSIVPFEDGSQYLAAGDRLSIETKVMETCITGIYERNDNAGELTEDARAGLFWQFERLKNAIEIYTEKMNVRVHHE